MLVRQHLEEAPAASAIQRLSDRYSPFQVPSAHEGRQTVFPLPERSVQDAVIVERFSAPGGPEINSLGFLDVMAAEKSVYNAHPWRNLSVLGSGSGEALAFGGAISVSDHLGQRRGLRTLAALHAGPFGSDGTYGTTIPSTTYITSPSFHKVNRNALLRFEGDEGSYVTASSYDNLDIQHSIPRNDFQYAWVSGSLLSGTTAFGHGTTPTFISSSDSVTTAGAGAGSHIDFVGINATIYDKVGDEFNILSSSILDDYRVNPGTGIGNAPGGSFVGINTNLPTVFNALMLHRNGAYGYPSWKQIDNRYHPLVRDMRESNTISIIDPDTTREKVRRNTSYLGYKWKTSPATLSEIFGQNNDNNSYTVTTDRSVLSYREPAIVQRYAPLKLQVDMEIGGKMQSVTIDASYANEKSHFTNSKLDMNLNLHNYGESGADLVLDSLSDGTLVGDLKSIKYTETVYPKAINTYLPKIRSRTEYICPFWRDERADRAEIYATTPFGISIASQSMWPLDGRLDPNGLAQVAADGAGTEGTLQNCYNTVHSREASGSCSASTGSMINIVASPTYSRRHTNMATGSVYAHSSFITASVTGVIPFSGDAPWDAAAQSGKTPFYDTYGEYVENMRLKGKEYSIIPEYRMSERMDDYIVNGVNPFEDSSLFSITGAVSASSSAIDDFYTVYSHSDFMKYFDVVENDAEQQSGMKAADITVKCKALLKLLPYDGFYPASRTVQMATLFSSSYGSKITMEGGGSALTAAQRKGGFRPFLTPMFAPGIVYNTIKSGIAVDFPVMTGTFSVSSSADSGSYFISKDYFDYRVPFETLVEPAAYLYNINLTDMEPHPSCSINVTASWNGEGDDRYKLSMNNFLAETPDFFLKNGTFTSFFSDTEENFKVAQSGSTYEMRVILRKTANQVDTDGDKPQIAQGEETICMYSRPSAFGPPSSGDSSAGARQGGSKNGYNAPFTPPYYDGASYSRVVFTAAETKRYSLEEILSGSYVLQNRRYTNWNSGGVGPQNGNRINYNAMQVTASVNLFGSTLGLQDLLKYEGVNLTTQESRWCIQTKFETPILNFVDASASATPITDTDICEGGEYTRPYGMWHQYGRLPESEEGIYLELKDPNAKVTGYLSLADLVGFKKSSEKLGKVATSKTIREAVVAVPFIEKNNSRQFFNVTIGDAMSDSVAKMVDSMGRYVFPPSMDFMKYPKEVKPFAMYIFEFEHQLNQQDLTDIWQNLPPRIGRAFDAEAPLESSEIVQEKQITHSLASGELLKKVGAKLQWMIFKVKQRASVNYWDKTVSTNPTLSKAAPKDAILPKAASDGVLKSTPGDYNYNWPYDFFSLVELVKVDEEVTFIKDGDKRVLDVGNLGGNGGNTGGNINPTREPLGSVAGEEIGYVDGVLANLK